MLRQVLARSLRSVVRTAPQRHQPVLRTATPVAYTTFSRPSHVIQRLGARCYSAPAGLSKDEVEGRIMDILKNFDKVPSLAGPFWDNMLTWVQVQDPSKVRSGSVPLYDLRLTSRKAEREYSLRERSWFGQSRYGGGCNGNRGGMAAVN